jgi:hypothetical protein
VWLRGVSRKRAKLDDWVRDLAPSDELRNWFHHDPERFDEFRARSRDELARQPDRLEGCMAMDREVYGDGSPQSRSRPTWPAPRSEGGAYRECRDRERALERMAV